MRSQADRRWFIRELEPLRQLAELHEEGLLIVDVLHEGDAAPSFRTLVQIDGDVMSSIAAAALADPDFAAAHARHLQHIGERLRTPTDRLRRWGVWVSMLASSTGAVVFGVGVHVLGIVTQTASSSWHELVVFVSSALGGIVGWPLGRRLLWWGVGRLIRKYADGQLKTNAALDRLAEKVGLPVF
jgi:hypothetical protein